MGITTLLADPNALCLEQINPAPSQITLVIRVVQLSSQCPLCQQPSTRVHSRYVRRVADLPWHGVAVRLAVVSAVRTTSAAEKFSARRCRRSSLATLARLSDSKTHFG